MINKNISLTDIENLAIEHLICFPPEEINKGKILNCVNLIASFHNFSLSEKEQEEILKEVETRVAHTVEHNFDIFFSDEYHPWLANAKSDIDFFYWKRYRNYLSSKDSPFAVDVLRDMDNITDQIIDHLEDPRKEGEWQRRGMVVGQVQAGKTANYIGVINKAADCGYKVLIILGGSLNILRSQTQERIDNGFIGIDTDNHKPTGVGLKSLKKKPISFTTYTSDFSSRIANQICADLNQFSGPVIFVIKKLPNSLRSLIEWLTKNNSAEKLKQNPMLLIDDEADYYGVNSNSPEKDATAINKYIRQLLSLFSRSSYVGYTATPFANIFIDPDQEQDIFPRDFILSMIPPSISNYIGPKRIFLENNSDDPIRIISDNDINGEPLPLKHKKNFIIHYLPKSLCEAIRVFILGKAIRLFKGQTRKCYSALINVTRYTALHGKIKNLIQDEVDKIKEAINLYSSLSEAIAIQNSELKELHDLYIKEFYGTTKDKYNNHLNIPWYKIQRHLKDSVSSIEVLEINSNKNGDILDYTKHNYPNGRTVIVVGGMSISRGITLEGLMVTYFLRNTVMYDTLMQMGRWFGYRPGYEELCRIYMTAQSRSWYIHITASMEDFLDQITRMKLAQMTPKDFGLCVRAHPDSLIITAKNKMRTAKEFCVQVSLEGHIIETTYLSSDKEILENNFKTAEKLLSSLQGLPEKTNPSGYLWRSSKNQLVKDFIKGFKTPSLSPITDPGPLCNYIDLLADAGKGNWDICFVSPFNESENGSIKISNITINRVKRNIQRDDKFIYVNADKRRLGYAKLESIGLPKDIIVEAEKKYSEKHEKSSISGTLYRKIRENYNPLLLIYILHGIEVNVEHRFTEDSHNSHPKRIISRTGNILDNIVAYSISFPGDSASKHPKKLVTYFANKVYQRLHEDDAFELEQSEDNSDYELD